METFLGFLALIGVCSLFFLVGFLAGKGRIEIRAPLTKDEKERRTLLLNEYENLQKEMNKTYGNFETFGGRVDEL